ncbi:MAG: transcription termination/antitermination NusG family protein [Phycisphaerae bacterium]
MLRSKENPPVQSPDDLSLDQFAGRWWVAHTKPRQEKALAWDVLRSEGIYFLPMYEITRTSRGRAWKSKLVLFPGYVFLCCQEEGRLRALQTGRIANLIEVVDQKRLISELSDIKRLIDTRFAIDPYPGLQAGTLCRVKSGPLAGLEGRVERRKNSTRFVVEVSMLGQGASVEIDAGVLESIE